MKRIIDGLSYDTTTATLIGNDAGYGPSDFRWYNESLYRTLRGRYFLAGEGGPMTRWAKYVPNAGWTKGDGIFPLSPAEALAWAENHLSPETVAEEFGEHIEDA